ncbi:MAG: pantetheine-phosphate adenylyltransferase [Elusimicrobia bacterium GWA2_69_24]|nr:MAG: pantetheine-phosphate adenylyltransferase [Elusimicrobia bacterium GWA2_69_24]HBL18997.1 pantetheine-phosphate adenylyltransferase [Elusimicrobiota bacterium]
MPRIAVYPGSFDPITNGHLDIVRRASRLCDHLYVAVADNSVKHHTFSVGERMAMVRAAIRGIPHCEVDTFHGLLGEHVKSMKATILIRGLRAVSDMDYEFQMASMNRRIYPDLETVFLMPDERYTYLSSSIVKDVTRMGAHVEEYLPPIVVRMLRRKFKLRKV